MAAPANTTAYMALGVPPPRKTFLDQRPTSGRSATNVVPAPPGSTAGPAVDTKSVILSEHKAEVTDMIQESIGLLKNIYRSKFVFGDHLRYVDPSYGGDNVGQFALSTPPSFSPAYVPPPPVQDPLHAEGRDGAPDGGDPSLREKLRTAEELIKRLYRRNAQLEVEQKYLQGEVTRMERFAGLARTESHNLQMTDGHLPMRHPLYAANQRRNCRSCPPSRTLLRSAVAGHGLAFPPRGGVQDAPPPREDPPAVAQLKRRVMQLTEALVSVQHENDKLSKEKAARVSLRDTLLRNYLVERDTHIAALHQGMQELLSTVANPMRLARSKQPGLNVNPVVAANNILKEVSERLVEQISSITGELVRKATTALPPAGAGTSVASPSRGAAQEDGANSNAKAAVIAAALDDDAQAVATRRKELTRRLRGIVDTLPVQKKKALLLLVVELRQLFDSVVVANRSLLTTYEAHKSRTDTELVQLKLELASLHDQLRAVGAFSGSQSHGGLSAPRAAAGGSRAGDPE